MAFYEVGGHGWGVPSRSTGTKNTMVGVVVYHDDSCLLGTCRSKRFPHVSDTCLCV